MDYSSLWAQGKIQKRVPVVIAGVVIVVKDISILGGWEVDELGSAGGALRSRASTAAKRQGSFIGQFYSLHVGVYVVYFALQLLNVQP